MTAGEKVVTKDGMRKGKFLSIQSFREQGKPTRRIALFELPEGRLWGCPPDDLISDVQVIQGASSSSTT